jgi:tetratricopeptide (TPR) repeat protein
MLFIPRRSLLLISIVLCVAADPARAASLPKADSGKAPMTDLSALERTIRDTWDFHDPAVSESRFQAMADSLKADPVSALLVRTQVARAQGLQRKFDDANATLDLVARDLPASAPSGRQQLHVQARLTIERGRVLNSGGEPGKARPLFEEAFALADSAGQPALAVDAAHMVAIAAANDSASSDALAWNERALAMAESSSDPEARSWRASLLNNLGWTYHDAGNDKKALDLFQRALAARREMGDARDIREARWSVARSLRANGRLDDALKEQVALEKENAKAGEPDGYVFEELGEILYAQGKKDEAKPWFAKAYTELNKDPYLRYDQPDRLKRLKDLSGSQ